MCQPIELIPPSLLPTPPPSHRCTQALLDKEVHWHLYEMDGDEMATLRHQLARQYRGVLDARDLDEIMESYQAGLRMCCARPAPAVNSPIVVAPPCISPP